MEEMVARFLTELKFGEMKTFGNMKVFPLFSLQVSDVTYLTLREALDSGALSITEKNAGGSVPELRVINRGDFPVLIIDGEELEGAKQNRIVNTSILIKVKWEGIIPVSCTERGRWGFQAEHFHPFEPAMGHTDEAIDRARSFKDSDVVMGHEIRCEKMRMVHDSLRKGDGFKSDQCRVWDGIDELHMKANVKRSPTRAMKDAFNEKRQNLDEYLNAFPPENGQKGLFVFINGNIAGFEIVSLDSAYRSLHSKLLKSYALDALTNLPRCESSQATVERAQQFVESATACAEERFESIGYGHDYRYHGTGIVGSSLVYNSNVIHSAFFKTGNGGERQERMTNLDGRRRFRMR